MNPPRLLVSLSHLSLLRDRLASQLLLRSYQPVEGLLRQIVMFASNDLTETTNRILELAVLAFQPSELRRHKEWLREKPLHFASTRND